MEISDLCLLGKRCYGYPMYAAMAGQSLSVVPHEPIKVDVKNPSDALFDVIFAVDPLSGLPRGDVYQLLNENVSPEIREFIQMQLMSPTKIDGDTSGHAGLSDDDVALFTRGSEESVYQYRERLIDHLRNVDVSDTKDS